ncbi:hypothetical protein QCE49_31925 [Caballeronia sp. LZ008]|uniref:hypothetical protein n=1 Tax=Caballeronia sp. LZ008 TaxID=3038560 RepID=UPI0028571DE9|nr:hypothetical protein [Caballeronia sp. LZ008]MDR5798017.1 hypothetical protein [Caballeronia sp. LZ008]
MPRISNRSPTPQENAGASSLSSEELPFPKPHISVQSPMKVSPLRDRGLESRQSRLFDIGMIGALTAGVVIIMAAIAVAMQLL